MTFTTVRASALLLLVGILTTWGLAGCASEPPPPFPDEDRLIETLMDEYVSARFAFYPVESTLAGLPGHDSELGSFSKTDVARRVAWLYDFHSKLMGVRLKALSRPAYLDALWLTSLTKAELLDLEERQLWRTSPAFYGDAIRDGITLLLLHPDLSTGKEGADALAGRLEAAAQLLEQANENLRDPPEALRREGLRSLDACRELLTSLPLLLEERLPSYRVAELAERSRVATRALQPLMGRMSHSASSEGSAALGAEGLHRYFLYREMVDWSPEKIVEKAESSLSALGNEITDLTLESFPDESLPAVLTQGEPPGSPEESVAQYAHRVRTFLRATRAEDAPEEDVPVRTVPALFLAPSVVRLWRPAALSPIKDVSLLVATPLGDEQERDLELLTLREVAGRYREYVHQSESASLLRRVFRARTTAEGFLDWLGDRLLERGYQKDDAALLLRHLYRRRLATLRLSIAIRLHAFGLSLAEAEREFRERGYLSRERAEEEAERASVDPDVGSAALGRLLLEEIEHDYVDSHPLSSSDELEEAILSQGLVPLRLIRFELLGIDEE